MCSATVKTLSFGCLFIKYNVYSVCVGVSVCGCLCVCLCLSERMTLMDRNRHEAHDDYCFYLSRSLSLLLCF